MFVNPADYSIWKNDQENASANIPPPPGLHSEIEIGEMYEPPKPTKLRARQTKKVEPASVELSLRAEEDELALENESLARANAQLAWENAMLHKQNEYDLFGDDSQAWWSQQQWGVNSPVCAFATQPGDLIYFYGLKNATELNDEYGIVDRWDDASQRWVVRIASGEEKFAKAENLMVVREQPYWHPWNTGSYDMNSFPQTRGKSKTGSVKKNNSATWSFASDSTAASVTFDAQNGDSGESASGRTTVMMRNLPNDYSGQMVLGLLDDQGFKGCYNLMYLPMDYQRKAGFGYAFIDMISPEEAERFHQHFEGFSEWKVASAKVCSVGWSTLQGLQAHIERYRNSPVMHDVVPEEFKPMLFENGNRVPFPTPSKSVRAPRMRKTGSNVAQKSSQEPLA